ncbi:MAG: HU family DNA-binding protein [Candidatus Omnitrophica bacterium]|nr:HU family DNA-binding protein [Candidatus Omnitrophota bacterium]
MFEKVSLIARKFLPSNREARSCNPQTGQSITIKARKVPAFSAGAELKKAVR